MPEAAVARWLATEPRTLAALAFITGLKRREVEAAVQSLRLRGEPIVSDGEGVRLARDSEDALRCAQRLRRRAIGQLVTARALREAGKRMALAEEERDRLTLWAPVKVKDHER